MSSSIKRVIAVLQLLGHQYLLLHLNYVFKSIFVKTIQLLQISRIFLVLWHKQVTQVKVVVVLIVPSHLEKLFLS